MQVYQDRKLPITRPKPNYIVNMIRCACT